MPAQLLQPTAEQTVKCLQVWRSAATCLIEVDAQPTLAFYATHSLTGYSCVAKADATGPAESILKLVQLYAEDFGSQSGLTLSMEDPESLSGVMAASPFEVLPGYTSSMRAIPGQGFAAPVSVQMGRSQVLVTFIWQILMAVHKSASKSERHCKLLALTMQQECERCYNMPQAQSTQKTGITTSEPSALNTQASSSSGSREVGESPVARDCWAAQRQLESCVSDHTKRAMCCLRTSLLLLKLASLCQLDSSKGNPPQPQQLFWILARRMQLHTLPSLRILSERLKQEGRLKELANVMVDVEPFFLSAAPTLVQSLRLAVVALAGSTTKAEHITAARTCLLLVECVMASDMARVWQSFSEELFRLGGARLCIGICMQASSPCML